MRRLPKVIFIILYSIMAMEANKRMSFLGKNGMYTTN
jgi:hypothetical protein